VSKQDGRNRRVTTGPVDDSTATILHMDMDAYYASVELLDHPELKGKPVIVGHDSRRSIVTAATYEARKYGVNSAMPMSVALRRCPNAIVLQPHFERYTAYSKQIMEICDDLTPYVERIGLDEAFLDVAGARTVHGSPLQIAKLLRARVLDETGLICSVGAASTKFVAKLASGLSKPDGLLIVPEDETLALLHPLPISALWGVGGKTEEVLRGRGYNTIGDLANTPLDVLKRVLGEAAGQRLHDLSWGRDPRNVQLNWEEKSIGHENTFEYDLERPELVHRELLRLSNMVAVRLRKAELLGRVISVKIRDGEFTTITRSRTLTDPTDVGRVIYATAKELYDSVAFTPARLVGVRAEQLQGEGAQVGLWDDAAGWREVEDVMDAATERFGRGAVKPATLLGHRTTERPRLGQRD
jgi:DNA polymerase-4